jgi:hypothetical protein
LRWERRGQEFREEEISLLWLGWAVGPDKSARGAQQVKVYAEDSSALILSIIIDLH